MHYQIHWRPEQDAVYWIHLSIAQDAGLEFWQTGSNVIITYQSVPKECVVKVVSESGKRELLARQHTFREGSNVTLRDTWVPTGSNVLRQPRETESKLQMWDSNPIPSESRSWSDEEWVQSVDLRVNDIPNDEIYKDKQYMQRIAEQVQKLVNTESFFLGDPLEDNILSEKAVKKIHEAGNCELHEVQRRTDKVQCQRCYSYVEAGFQVCPCGGTAEYVGRNAFLLKTKKLKNSLQTPTRHSRKSAEPSMVLSCGKSITSTHERDRGKRQIYVDS